MKKIYSQIQECLCQIHPSLPQGNALKGVNNLSYFITGMIRRGKSSLEAMGSGIAKNTDSQSKTARASRFIKSKFTDYDSHYLPYITSFLQAFLARSIARDGIRIVIDGTQVGKENASLVVSIVWKKRGIPICWFVKKGGKGHFKVKDHITVIKQFTEILLPILPENMEVTLLGDGEFDSIELQKHCLFHSWNYVLRTACDTVLYENGELFSPRNIGIPSQATHFFIANVAFTKKRFQYVQLVVQHDKKHKQPIFLISNLEYAIDIMGYYKERYSIECLFRDMKTTSFNIHLTRLKKPEEVSNLIIIAALAFIFLLILGMQHDTLEWRKKVQRVRKDQKVLSLFSFACRLIVFLVDNEIDFIFFLKFHQNPNDFSKSFTQKSFVGF